MGCRGKTCIGRNATLRNCLLFNADVCRSLKSKRPTLSECNRTDTLLRVFQFTTDLGLRQPWSNSVKSVPTAGLGLPHKNARFFEGPFELMAGFVRPSHYLRPFSAANSRFSENPGQSENGLARLDGRHLVRCEPRFSSRFET